MGDTMMTPTGVVTARRVFFSLGVLLMLLTGSLFAFPYLLPASIEKTLVRKTLESVLQRSVRISGETSLSLLPSLQLTARNLVISTGEHSGLPELADIEMLRVEVDVAALLSSTLEISELYINRPTVRFYRGIDEATNWQLPVSGAAEGSLNPPDYNWGWWQELRVGNIQLQDGRFLYDDRQSGRRLAGNRANFRATMSSVTGAVDGLSIGGDIELNGKPVSLNLDMGSMQRLMSGGRIALNAELSSPLIKARYQGTMAKRQHMVTEGMMSLDLPNLVQFEKWFGRVFAKPVEGGLKWRAGFFANADRIAFEDMRLSMARGQYSGTLLFRATSADHILDGDIKATTLDVSPLTNMISDMRWFDQIDGTLRLRWEKMLFNRLQFGAGELTARLQPGKSRVSLDLSRLSMYGGTARGEIEIAHGEGMISFNSRFHMVNVNAAPLLRGGQSSIPLAGRTNLNLALFSVGSSPSELLSALRGSGEFNIVDGAVLTPELASYLPTDDNRKLEFSQLIGSFSIEQGVVSGRDLLLKAAQLSLMGDGTIDLARNKVDFFLQSLLRRKQNDADTLTTVQPFLVQGDLNEIRILNEET